MIDDWNDQGASKERYRKEREEDETRGREETADAGKPISGALVGDDVSDSAVGQKRRAESPSKDTYLPNYDRDGYAPAPRYGRGGGSHGGDGYERGQGFVSRLHSLHRG